MKVVFDTNIYISWIREQKYPDLILNTGTQKYLSSVVLMELWSGAKTKQGVRTIVRFQTPYISANRLLILSINDFITSGRIISNMPNMYKNKIKNSSFINDIYIALNAKSIGALLYTENKEDFKIIANYLDGLKVEYL
jgi:predicted nucleic acid-binding protein